MMQPAKRALLSVANKEGLVPFARGLAERGFEVVSSGGTAKVLEDEGVPVRRVGDVTGFPEILGGRVKTLNPHVHGGILARRHLPSDLEELEKHEILPVDVVAVNFYPFERKVAQGSPIEEVLENIDIGGPSMLRASAKNFKDVLSVSDPKDYSLVLGKLDEGVDLGTKLYLAVKAFRASAGYESAIAAFMDRLSAEGSKLALGGSEAQLGMTLSLHFEKVQDLRYGENPHQTASFYCDADSSGLAVAGARKLAGKDLSYNNILDLDAAWRIVRDLPSERSAAVVIKHTNPCGAALGDSLRAAYVSARATDPVSAFGGIVAFNRFVDGETATELVSTFLEAVIAPGFDDQAVEILSAKKNVRLMQVDDPVPPKWEGLNFCRVLGGLLIQDWDREDDISFDVRTERKPSVEEQEALRFAWIISKHVKSNAIVIARQEALVGVGAGQMSRVDSCRLAIEKAQSELEGTVAASDAFFPFRDGVDTLADAGVKAIIQPGGSIRDEEVVAAANERGLAMVFTGKRHFKH